jgi:hypothetical protein
MKDVDHPLFRPLWRRVALVFVCLLWAAMEFYGGSQTWSLVALGFAVYAAAQFLLFYRPAKQEPPAETQSRD